MRPDPRVLLVDIDRAGADISLPQLRRIVRELLAELGPLSQ